MFDTERGCEGLEGWLPGRGVTLHPEAVPEFRVPLHCNLQPNSRQGNAHRWATVSRPQVGSRVVIPAVAGRLH